MLKIRMTGGKLNFKAPIDLKEKFAREVAEPEMINQMKVCKDRAQANQRATSGAIKSSYSDSYIRQIIEGNVRGANGVRKTTTDVNLTVTGEFLGSMQTKRTNTGATGFFSGTHATKGSGSLLNSSLAGYLFQKGFDGWFDFSDSDTERIMQRFRQFMDRHTKDLVNITP